jgi:hypothetical protein
MQVSVRTPKVPPIIGPIAKPDFDFPPRTLATPGVASNVGLEEDCCIGNDDGNE